LFVALPSARRQQIIAVQQSVVVKRASAPMFHVKTKHEHCFDILTVSADFPVFTFRRAPVWVSVKPTPVADEPLIRRAARDTFSRKGRRKRAARVSVRG
jgi:hypothetical protein